jgi:hypothetical protein
MARAEDSFFDDLARGLADGSITRGKALRLMGAAVVGGTLGALGIGEASADPPGCKRNGKTCTRNDQCCSGRCSGGSCRAQTTTTTSTSTTTSTTTTSTTTPMCLPNQTGPCTADTQCCSGICTIPSGSTSLRCFSCRGFGGACAADQTCCTGTCENGTCCATEGQGCGVDADCCIGATCQGGLCSSA